MKAFETDDVILNFYVLSCLLIVIKLTALGTFDPDKILLITVSFSVGEAFQQ